MNAQAAKDTATTTIVKPPYMQNRELSWLDFNKRVLDQGADPTVPLLERLNFISIFWSNLQEFFMVRVGSLTDLSLLKKSIIDPKSGMTPAQQLEAIYARCHELYPYYEETYESVSAALLAEQDIRNLRKEELTDEQLDYLRGYMQDNVLPVPLSSDHQRPPPLPTSGKRRPVHRGAPRRGGGVPRRRNRRRSAPAKRPRARPRPRRTSGRRA